MAQFRKKPVVIEAMQFTGVLADWVFDWMDCEIITEPSSGLTSVDILKIKTLEGVMEVDPGDWVIKGVKGEFYPCKPDIFEMTYEPV